MGKNNLARFVLHDVNLSSRVSSHPHLQKVPEPEFCPGFFFFLLFFKQMGLSGHGDLKSKKKKKSRTDSQKDRDGKTTLRSERGGAGSLE